ncbi:histone methylation protein DOT1-domain-containing protein, partial [Lentinula novae-zelandiae]
VEEAVQQSDHGALIKNLASINKIFSSVPPLAGADASCYFRLLQEIYGRCLKPNHTLLKSGRDNTVYGELMPIFLERLFNKANLVEDSVFLDLGSGAGNTVAQAALTHRCRSFGIEIRRDVAAIAETMLQIAIVRSEIWGIPIGKMEVVCGDMLQSAEVIEWINTADLVLVNNRIFLSSRVFCVLFYSQVCS